MVAYKAGTGTVNVLGLYPTKLELTRSVSIPQAVQFLTPCPTLCSFLQT